MTQENQPVQGTASAAALAQLLESNSNKVPDSISLKPAPEEMEIVQNNNKGSGVVAIIIVLMILAIAGYLYFKNRT